MITVKKFTELLARALDLIFPRTNDELLADTASIEDFLPHVSVARVWSDDTRALLPYRKPLVSASVKALKYRGRTHIAEFFGTLAHDTLLEDISEWLSFQNDDALLVVPIPLAPARLNQRGYNQAALIAAAFVMSEPAWVLAPTALMRTKNTPSQTRQETRQARIENLKGAFAVPDRAAVHGKTIVLIDDVVTTGATIEAARKALLDAGAKKVYAIAIAH